MTVVIGTGVVNEAVDASQAPYNADPTGNGHSAAGINAALSYASTAKRGRVIVAPGIYSCESSIVIPAGVELDGLNRDATTLKAASDFGWEQFLVTMPGGAGGQKLINTSRHRAPTRRGTLS